VVDGVDRTSLTRWNCLTTTFVNLTGFLCCDGWNASSSTTTASRQYSCLIAQYFEMCCCFQWIL